MTAETMPQAAAIGWPVLALMAGVAGAAGFIDAIAGGGGLLTVPSLALVGLPPHAILATNKGQSVFGSGMALTRYAHSPLLERRRAPLSFVCGLLGAGCGVLLVSQVSGAVLGPVIAALLTAVAIFMIFYRPPQVHGERVHRPWPVAALIATVIATYDGFFGPGTGTFLILSYVLVYKDRLDEASANAKVVNFASNLGALMLFALKGWVWWQVALPMAAGQAVGGYLGAHVTVRVGRGLVRWAVVAISLALVGRLAWQMLH